MLFLLAIDQNFEIYEPVPTLLLFLWLLYDCDLCDRPNRIAQIFMNYTYFGEIYYFEFLLKMNPAEAAFGGVGSANVFGKVLREHNAFWKKESLGG